MRALCSQRAKKTVFFKSLFRFSKMDIKKYVQFSKPKHFLKQEFVTEKYSQKISKTFVTIYGLKIKIMKKHDFLKFIKLRKIKLRKKFGSILFLFGRR